MPLPSTALTLPRSRTLQHDLEYQAVYGAKMKKAKGPFAVFAMPNGRAFHRLGLAVAKRGGTAPARNRVKRLIREAFRHEQHSFTTENTESTEGNEGRGSAAGGRHYDIVVSASASASDTLTLEQARALLRDLVDLAHKAWERRVTR